MSTLDFSKNLSVFFSDTEFKKEIIKYLSEKEEGKREIKLCLSGICHQLALGKRIRLNLKPDIYTISLEDCKRRLVIKDSKGNSKYAFSVYGGVISISSYDVFVDNNVIVTSLDLMEDCINFYNNRINDIIDKLGDMMNKEVSKLKSFIKKK